MLQGRRTGDTLRHGYARFLHRAKGAADLTGVKPQKRGPGQVWAQWR